MLRLLLLISIIIGSSHLDLAFADEDADLKALQADKAKSAKAYKYIEDNLNAVKGDSQNVLKELQGALNPKDMKELQDAMASGDQEKINRVTKKLSVNLMKDGKNLDKVIKFSMKRFQGQSASQLRTDLMTRAQGTPIAALYKNFPKILDLTVNMLRDPFAVPQLAKIPQDKKRLLTFLGVNVAIFILSWMVKKQRRGKSPISRWAFFTALRFGVLLFFFKAELTPAFLVFKKTFLT